MKIAIVGTRGVPAKYGGFETFAEELSIRLVKMGIQVEVYCDKNSHTENKYKSVGLIYSKYSKTENPIKYYNDCITSASLNNDIVLICGTGGALFLLKKYFYLRKPIYVTNTDGIEYKRNKWPLWGRLLIRLTEIFTAIFSDYMVADSAGIKRHLHKNYNFLSNERVKQIEYGAEIFLTNDYAVLEKYKIIKKKYYLVVSRLEPENNLHIILKGFIKAYVQDPLIIVGNHLDTDYFRYLKSFESDKIIFIGGVYNKLELANLRYYCKAYLHGHSVGGTNPSLLEALGCGNIIIAHDNIFNREVIANKMFYFSNEYEATSMINRVENLKNNEIQELEELAIKRIKEYYNWNRIASDYLNFFNEIITIRNNKK
jgi:glycosyltransferase involved in cell wall biosynthesis